MRVEAILGPLTPTGEAAEAGHQHIVEADADQDQRGESGVDHDKYFALICSVHVQSLTACIALSPKNKIWLRLHRALTEQLTWRPKIFSTHFSKFMLLTRLAVDRVKS